MGRHLWLLKRGRNVDGLKTAPSLLYGVCRELNEKLYYIAGSKNHI